MQHPPTNSCYHEPLTRSSCDSLSLNQSKNWSSVECKALAGDGTYCSLIVVIKCSRRVLLAVQQQVRICIPESILYDVDVFLADGGLLKELSLLFGLRFGYAIWPRIIRPCVPSFHLPMDMMY